MKSRVKGDFQARFRENVGVKFPCVTRLAVSLLMTLNQLDNSKSNEKTKTYEITNFTFSYTFFLQ